MARLMQDVYGKSSFPGPGAMHNAGFGNLSGPHREPEICKSAISAVPSRILVINNPWWSSAVVPFPKSSLKEVSTVYSREHVQNSTLRFVQWLLKRCTRHQCPLHWPRCRRSNQIH